MNLTNPVRAVSKEYGIEFFTAIQQWNRVTEQIKWAHDRPWNHWENPGDKDKYIAYYKNQQDMLNGAILDILKHHFETPEEE